MKNQGTPANIEAEEGLLACCILDESQEVIAKCIDSSITQDCFFETTNQIIFEAIRHVHSLGLPMSEMSICESLNSAKQLDFVGGHSEINRISNRVETTVQYLYYLEIVKEKSLLRKLIYKATNIIEGAKNNETVTELLQRADSIISLADAFEPAEKRQGAASKRAESKLLKRVESHKFDLSKPPVEAPWLLKLAGVEILHPGNILSIIAPQKSGKSTTQSAIISSFFGMEGGDFLGFLGAIPEGKQVIHFDTEQSARDHYSMMLRTLKRAHWTDFPPWFSSLHIRRFDSSERRKIVLASARKAHSEGGIAILMIDGIVDLLQDFNDVKEATGLINDLMSICEETGCSIINTLHVNPGAQKGKESDKGRGHLGTMMEQKSETILLLKKDIIQGVDHITLSTKDARHGGIKTPPVFRWCDQARMHVSVSVGDGFTSLSSLSGQKTNEMATIARDIFDGWQGGAMTYSMISERIRKSLGVAERTAIRRINDLLRSGDIIKTDSGHYALNPKI